SLSSSFLRALEGAISILLTLYAGYLIALNGYIDRPTVQRLSKLCSIIFLPCLIIVQMGPELTTEKLSRLWIIPVWGLSSTLFTHLVGWVGQVVCKMPSWTIGRPNSTALPLLLIQSLQYTGVLEDLSAPGESVSETLDRAKSLILLNVVVQQTFTYQFAPAILRRDKRKKNNDEEEEGDGVSRLAPAGESRQHLPPIVQDMERVGLLQDQDTRSYGTNRQGQEYSSALNPIADQLDVHWPRRIAFAEKPIKKMFNWMSPPLIGAIIALLLGIIPPVHKAFLSKGGPLYSSITQSVKNLGDLFVVLQNVIVGSELALVPHTKPGFLPTTYCLIVRFLIMPALSILFVWVTA
ncbi:hypothetical protein K474DRAFT_1564825, partial [Panus rudis PR-1116 ss-1]